MDHNGPWLILHETKPTSCVSSLSALSLPVREKQQASTRGTRIPAHVGHPTRPFSISPKAAWHSLAGRVGQQGRRWSSTCRAPARRRTRVGSHCSFGNWGRTLEIVLQMCEYDRGQLAGALRGGIQRRRSMRRGQAGLRQNRGEKGPPLP